MELSKEEQQKLDHARLVVEMADTPNWKAFVEKNILPGVAFLFGKLSGKKKLTVEEYSSYFERREGIEWVLAEVDDQRRIISELERKLSTEPDNSPATGELA